MKVIPAIDLKDGQCVRLQKGDYGTAHKVAENAVETALKLPQIGWNALDILRPNAMTEGLENGSYVYFVHSFMAKPSDENDLAAVTDYGTRVPAMVARENLFGCQFHPEKSGEVGLQMLRNFAKLTEVGK